MNRRHAIVALAGALVIGGACSAEDASKKAKGVNKAACAIARAKHQKLPEGCPRKASKR